MTQATNVSVPTAEPTRWSETWHTFARNRAAVVGLLVLGLLVLAAVLAPWIAPHDPATQHLDLRRAGPSSDAWLGRDEFGRDILSRIMIGARSTLLAAVGSVALSGVVGTLIGVLAGYRGGVADSLLMRTMDLVLSFPYFLLAILVVAVAGPSLRNAAIAIGITYIPQYARVVRGATLEVMSKEYIEAAHASGVRGPWIAWRHVLPNINAPIIVITTVGLALAIVGISSLSFLGLGAQPPSPEWGAMLASGRQYVASAPHISVFPGVAILITVLSLNLVGDGLRDTFDPTLR
ncbi:ABC transporter permease [Nocardioides sp. SLBN-35]|uniref:ABC transporter permease n=1 Tax=Nocardioides sp. SLBN-35 TaxID=2768445 RepID=UPI001151CAE8|nr:ABC transporter permease [Nocardioides sp. SLBN-35]TQK72836.1 peptide/nickel transport system permease protein/glutathione transport system permease protein [Nocardioides sp. SLBN-35]